MPTADPMRPSPSLPARPPLALRLILRAGTLALAAALLLLPLSGLQGQVPGAESPRQGEKPAVTGEEYMVSSSHPIVNEAMVEVLENGGNAVDAMITAVLLQPVVEPHMSTIAGGTGGLIYMAESQELIYLDAELNLSRSTGASGITSGGRIGVPGTIRGLSEAGERYGTLSWAQYLEPAIQVAEDGFPMYSYLYYYIMEGRERLSAHPASREIFLPGGVAPEVGETFRQPELAATLRQLAQEGPEYFYTGEWARTFVEKVNDTGGNLELEELDEYQVRWVDPVRFDYRGHPIVSAPPASNAGVLIGMILNILENFDLEGMGHYTESPEALLLLRQAYDQAQNHISRFVGDPRSMDVPVEDLLSKAYAQQIAALIQGSRQRVDLRDGEPLPEQASVPAQRPEEGTPVQDTDTNHLVVVDGEGNWVSMTHTVYGSTFATGLTVGGVGVNSGNGFQGTRVGEGRRVITPFPATMVLDQDGRPHAALGSPGMSSRAVAMTLINLLGYGMDLHSAIHAPRFQGYGPGDVVRAESRFSQEALDELKAWGVSYELVGGYDQSMGSMHGVIRDLETGLLTGVADARRTGFAAGR
jgi:gamma-glutamyltranspeptidase / glutathione hydrolase